MATGVGRSRERDPQERGYRRIMPKRESMFPRMQANPWGHGGEARTWRERNCRHYNATQSETVQVRKKFGGIGVYMKIYCRDGTRVCRKYTVYRIFGESLRY